MSWNSYEKVKEPIHDSRENQMSWNGYEKGNEPKQKSCYVQTNK